MPSLPFGGHDGGILVSRTDYEVGHAPIGAPHDLPVWFSHPLDPVVTLLIGLGQVLPGSVFQDGGSLKRLNLLSSKTTRTGTVILTYQPRKP